MHMKKILFALLGVLTLFVSCSKDSNLDDYNKHPEKALEIALAKLPDYHIYSGSTVLKSSLVPTETRAGFAASHRGLKEYTTPDPGCPSKMPLRDVEKNSAGQYKVQAGWDYTVYGGETLTAGFDVSSTNGGTFKVHVASGATLNVTGSHNGCTDVEFYVYTGGTLNYGWNEYDNSQKDGTLAVGNGGTAHIFCWGKLGTYRKGNIYPITDVFVKAGSELKIYNTGDIKTFKVNGDLFSENSGKATFYSEVPVEVTGTLKSNSGEFIFDNDFTAGGISTNAGSKITFRKCASVSGDVFMSGESDIYVDSYLNVGRISFDQGRMHLNSAMFDAGTITIPAEGGNAYIEATNNDLSIVKSGQIRLSSFVDANYKTTALKGNLVVVCTDVTNGNTGWNGNAINIGNLGVESGVRFNPATSTYYLPAENNCRPAMGEDPNKPIYYKLVADVVDECKGMGTAEGSADNIPAGTQKTIKAIPNTGYEFVSWSDGNTEATRTLTINQDTYLYASFQPIKYTLEVVVKDGQEGWGTVTGGGTYNYGDEPTYSATPADGYRFVKWEETNSTNASEQVTMDGNKKFTAVFEPVPTYDLTVIVTPGQEEWGTVSGSETNIPEGESRIFEAVPNDGYEFVGWTDGNTDARRTVTMDKDYEFIAIFKKTEKEPDPEDPIYYEDKGHVEVNLSVNDKKDKDDYIWSKLSIHVRDTTDVEIFIPVGAEYYCEADDFYIVQKHDKEDAYVYTDNTEKVEMEIAGQKVTLTIKHEQNGMRITTDGINSAVLKECRKTYGDGITFEVYSYYNEKITSREMLKTMLDQTTIKFLDEEPDYYINAFGKVREYTAPIYSKTVNNVTTLYTDEACTQILPYQYWERTTDGGVNIFGHKNPWDCVVTPIDVASGHFTTFVEGEYNKNYPQVPETK